MVPVLVVQLLRVHLLTCSTRRPLPPTLVLAELAGCYAIQFLRFRLCIFLHCFSTSIPTAWSTLEQFFVTSACLIA